MIFHSIRIGAIEKLTDQAVKIVFEIPTELKSRFQFTPGQHITLKANGKQRDYSLCTSPLDNEWSIGVKAVREGGVSDFLVHQLNVGDFLEVSEPIGKFGIPTKPDEKRTIFAFAAGSGITPILSILKYTLQTEKWIEFHLFYANKSPDDVMFLSELQALKKQYHKQFQLHMFYSRHAMESWFYEGRIDAHKFELILNQLVDIDEADEVIICGPGDMIKTLSREALKAGVSKFNVHFELFEPDVSFNKILPNENHPKKVNVKVKLHGKEYSAEWHPGENLIDTMLDAGIDAPYSCKGGVCSSCICQLEKGEVDLGENFILTDSDIKNGLILACISKPKTESITLNYEEI